MLPELESWHGIHLNSENNCFAARISRSEVMHLQLLGSTQPTDVLCLAWTRLAHTVVFFFFNLTVDANFLKSKGFTQECRLFSFSLKKWADLAMLIPPSVIYTPLALSGTCSPQSGHRRPRRPEGPSPLASPHAASCTHCQYLLGLCTSSHPHPGPRLHTAPTFHIGLAPADWELRGVRHCHCLVHTVHTQRTAWSVVSIQASCILNEQIQEWMSYAKNKQPDSPNNSVVETSSKYWQCQNP